MRTKLAARIEDISQQITTIVSSDNAVRDVAKQLELEFRGVGLQVSELSKSVSELKGEIADVANRKGVHDAQQVDVELRQDNAELAKIESGSEQIETRPKCVVRLSLGKKRGLYPPCAARYTSMKTTNESKYTTQSHSLSQQQKSRTFQIV